MRKIVSILCALLLVLGTTQVVFASAPEETPPPPATDNNEYNTPYDPVGEYSPEELQSLQSSQPQPRNLFMPLYVHEIIAITKTYKGERDRGIVATCTPSPANTHLSYSEARKVGNSFSTSIGLSKGVVDARLGYNVTEETVKTASYRIEVPAGKSAYIGLKDKYDVTMFNCQIVKKTFNSISGVWTSQASPGTGWSEKWTHYSFYSNIY